MSNEYFKPLSEVHAVTVAATGPITIGAALVDGYTVQAGDVVLLCQQATAADNGPYLVSSAGVWQKQNTYGKLFAPVIIVLKGDTLAGAFFFQTDSVPHYVQGYPFHPTGANGQLLQLDTTVTGPRVKWVDAPTGTLPFMANGQILVGATNGGIAVTPSGDILQITSLGTVTLDKTGSAWANVNNASGHPFVRGDLWVYSDTAWWPYNNRMPKDFYGVPFDGYVLTIDSASGWGMSWKASGAGSGVPLMTDAQLLIGQPLAGGLPVAPLAKDVAGDVTINDTGVTTIGALKVTNGMLAANAVTSAKIADKNVTAAKLLGPGVAQVLAGQGGGAEPVAVGPATAVLPFLGFTGAGGTQLGFRQVDLAAPDVKGVLPVANGGTGGMGGGNLMPVLGPAEVPIGQAAGAALSKPLSGDVTMNAGGVVTIQNNKVTGAMLVANAVDLAGTKVTGVLPLVNGGTGIAAASNAEAFDQLSPTMLQGDMIVFDGTHDSAISHGTDGQVLVTDTTLPQRVKWADAAMPVMANKQIVVADGTVPKAVTLKGDVEVANVDGTVTLKALTAAGMMIVRGAATNDALAVPVADSMVLTSDLAAAQKMRWIAGSGNVLCTIDANGVHKDYLACHIGAVAVDVAKPPLLRGSLVGRSDKVGGVAYTFAYAGAADGWQSRTTNGGVGGPYTQVIGPSTYQTGDVLLCAYVTETTLKDDADNPKTTILADTNRDARQWGE